MPQKYKVFFNHNIVYLSNNSVTVPNCENEIINPSKTELQSAVQLLFSSKSKLILSIKFDDVKLGWKLFKQQFEYRKAAGGLVLNKRGEILFIKRKGFWDLPKGHIEKMEKKKAAAIREVTEECGINQLNIEKKLTTTYHAYKIKSGIVLKPSHWYLMNYGGNEPLIPQTDEGITDARWFKEKEIPAVLLNTFPSIRDVIEKFNSENLAFYSGAM